GIRRGDGSELDGPAGGGVQVQGATQGWWRGGGRGDRDLVQGHRVLVPRLDRRKRHLPGSEKRVRRRSPEVQAARPPRELDPATVLDRSLQEQRCRIYDSRPRRDVEGGDGRG